MESNAFFYFGTAMMKHLWGCARGLFGQKNREQIFFPEHDADAGRVERNQIEKYNLDRRLVIADVGCRWGFAERYLEQLESFTVYGFDPDVEECQRLNERYKSKNILAVPVALAKEAGERILYLTKEPACSSLIKPDGYLTSNYPALDCATEVGQVSVWTSTLDVWAADAGVQAIDHLKIDTQGSELDILKGSEGILKTVRSIEVEVEFNPIYEGQPVFSDVDKYLRAQGFVLWKLSNFVHYSKRKDAGDSIGRDAIYYDSFRVVDVDVHAGQLYWANANYVREDIVRSFDSLSYSQRERDRALFSALGMLDVIEF